MECAACHSQLIDDAAYCPHCGERQPNTPQKRSPYLVDWDDLPDRAREWNRSAARDIPTLLASVGLAISK